MKKPEILLKEYVRRLNESDLSNLHKWYGYSQSGGKAEIVNSFSNDREMDKWLSSAASANELFDMIDFAGDYVRREYQWRNNERQERKNRKYNKH